MVIVFNLYNPPKSPLDFAFLFEQASRICAFIVLLSIYFGLRSEKRYSSADAERQSLLRKKLTTQPTESEDSVVNGNNYGGTTDRRGQGSDTDVEANDSGSEDSYLARERKAQEMIAKRLNEDGNWFTYASGFAVSFFHVVCLPAPG